jgi:hypothetical protein
VITYSYVVKNTGNVTLSGPFNVSDDKLGSFQCGTATSLAPGASTTCTKSYTIQASDLNATNNASITNHATATGKFGTNTVTSNQAQATVNQVAASAKLAPTQTTCSDFANGTAADLTDLFYGVRGNAINNIAPGVLFYYSKVTAPSSSFSIQVLQWNSQGFPALGVQQQSGNNPQIILYDASCVKSGKQGATTVAVDPTTKMQTVSIAVSGATVGQVFYVSIKYDPGTLVGQPVTTPYPTVPYTFLTSINNNAILSSQDSLKVNPK